ncbi:non-ribosomal peptide synthetase [Amycolatopsis mediterranei S699]|uniref:Non-ribosomal peptide synthetase n=4 Tax=Amycolatopsis mediterranei TaxID=33910 RepID=A0A0H3DCM2_AMYMU|nr:non-ribosomal peptide synthetase [Amycolatopsis mediterranei]ADJ47972.1 non-ribosomal peptide synthetase [Amycolatopsis mediterranei U32]AEK44872.1 non-ribosomal peptide synthetase [Amycolatopsis mediterranei S699]AFO79683.1 non-ribosomal peptide synthetase [Amycolatopsis mediterranei S699]AGT86811.1 non-ribosomal peptide synthetase [Amycolatopsis mediterranei RB]KDO10458.1 peptide synthetase [Amycolatopsis mediterranei]
MNRGTLVDLLRRRAEDTPDRTAFEFPGDGDRLVVDYRDLDRRARGVAAVLHDRGLAGERAVLLYPPGIDYVAGFFGCLYAGVVAVPVYLPTGARGAARMLDVAADAGARVLLSTAATRDALAPSMSTMEGPDWLLADDIGDAPGFDGPGPGPDDLAFLQYTSGSTGTPKGVRVRHANLMANLSEIGRLLGAGAGSHAVSWLPPYHDMGLIGGILQPVHGGFPCTLLSPAAFLRAPVRWLAEISRSRATFTAAPDFGYRECVRRISETDRAGLDLSSLRHALVGAEPVRRATLDEFTRAFAGAGFRRSAFHPCYGLAEATLLVTGGSRPDGPAVVEVGRAELAEGTVLLDPPAGHPAVTLTGCGWATGEDLVVVDAEPGGVGEICVSGPSVTDGYHGRPAETAARFGAELPGHPARRFLRTGDLGFSLAGQLYVTGRVTDLMVLRGRNHYPEDIEQTAERAHPALRPGRTVAFSVDDGDDEHLVLVHEVAAGTTPETADAVRAAVRAAIVTEHGVTPREVALVRQGAIARTTSGKVRRAATKANWLEGALTPVAGAREASVPGADVRHATATAATVATAAESDDRLASIVAGVLDLDPVPAAEPLVGLGLDSLRAVRLAEAVAEAFGAEIPTPRLLDGLTLTGLRALLAEPPRVRPATVDISPSRAQEAMWLLDSMGAGAAYHVHGGVRLTGPLDPDRLARCLDGLLARHPSLRTTFAPDADGTLVTTVRPPGPLPLRRLTEADDAERALHDLATAPFDLAAGPLVRAVLIRRREDWYLGIAAHHVVVDGWSLGVLLRELGEAYRGTPLPAVRPVPPRHWDGSDAAFWRATLDGARPLDLPLDAPARPAWRGGTVDLGLDAAATARLTEYGAARQATPFMVLLTALGVVAARWSGQDDFVLGAAAANRDHTNADAVGLFVNVLPLRLDTAGAPAFDDLLGRVRARGLAAQRHQAVPLDEIVRLLDPDRSDGRAPLVRAVLALQNVPLQPWQVGDVRAEAFELPAPGAQFELSVHLTQQADGGLAGHLTHADLFSGPAARRFADAFTHVLRTVADLDGVPVDDVPLLDESERARITGHLSGARTAPAAPGLLHELFERQADADPHAPAVVGDRALGYGELDAEANRLAWLLRERGVGPERTVAVCLPRSADLVVALLAVLKAGGCYVPLDPANPTARLAGQLRDVRPVVVLTDRELPGHITVGVGDAAAYPAHRPEPAAVPGNLVYAIHTSGTTGRPKAVMNEHAGLVNRIRWMQAEYGLTAGERVLHKTPIGFDVAGWELFWPLSAGATVVLARPDGHRDAAYLAALIRESGVSTCHFVPSMLRAFVEEPAVAGCAATLRRVVCSGEELPPSTVTRLRALLPDVAVHNLYGPTEAAIDVTAVEITPGHETRPRLPIGHPITGARLYVLDPRGAPVPVGVPGELFIGGVQVARGYLGRPALTAERFVPDPFEPGGRLYRTGDRARWTTGGALEFLGRLDQQVKIRGVRIEPAEVEAALAGYPGVTAAAVDARPGPDGEPRLVAYLVGVDDAPDSAVRAFLGELLPPAAVPSAFVRLPALPTGRTGKLDRSALPEPAVVQATGTAPRDPVEQVLAGIWAEVLGLPSVSVTSGFFELGGHSLLATRIVARVRREFGVELSAADLLGGGSTVADLAAVVRAAQLEQADPDELRRALEELADLTDDEVAALLADDRTTPRRTDG